MMNLRVATTIMFGLFIYCMSIPNAFAQAPDTVDVPVMIDGTPLGAINKFIQGDTTTTGERSNPNRVYRLARGQIYFVDGTLMSQGYHLRIMGEPEDPANPVKPATIAPGIRADGSFANILMQARGDLTVENVYFMGRPPTGAQDIMLRVNWAIQVAYDNGRVELKNCTFEWVARHCVAINSEYNDVFVSDCYFRNNQSMNGIWGGAGIVTNNNPADSVVIVNNSFVNCNCLPFNVRFNTVNYCSFQHNTIVNSLNEFTLWDWWSNATFSNNIFYNVHSIGETPEEMSTHDPDGLLWGIANVDTIPADFLAQLGISEQDRMVDVNNNCYFHDQKVFDFLNSIDTVYAEPWMNERTQAMFDADESYPHLVTENNINTDPKFTSPPENLDLMIEWMTYFREFASTPTYHWGWDPDDDGFNIQWPLPEDLSYSEASALYTGGSDGFPIGDLNWFPDKKAEWEQAQDNPPGWTKIGDEDEGWTLSGGAQRVDPTAFGLPVGDNGSAILMNGAGKAAEYTFIGTKVRVYVITNPNGQSGHIIIDADTVAKDLSWFSNPSAENVLLFESADLGEGTHTLKVLSGGKGVDVDYIEILTSGVTEIAEGNSDNNVSDRFQLFQNYPNPFNPVTEISYQLQTPGLVKLTVYNMLGQRVKELVNTQQPAGVHSVQWNGTDASGQRMSSGLYYYHLETDGFKATKKMLLLK